MSQRKREAPYGKKADDFFVVASTAGMTALNYWLEKRNYNDMSRSNDRMGQPLVGLINVVQGEKRKAGVICVSNRDFYNDVVSCVEKNMGFDDVETGNY